MYAVCNSYSASSSADGINTFPSHFQGELGVKNSLLSLSLLALMSEQDICMPPSGTHMPVVSKNCKWVEGLTLIADSTCKLLTRELYMS